MTVSPDKATLEQWFASDEDLETTLSAVSTKEPGFAVVCKTWNFHIPNTDGKSQTPMVRPPEHICDILTVSNNGRTCLWVVCSAYDAQTVGRQFEYLLTIGRMIKYKLHERRDRDLSNL